MIFKHILLITFLNEPKLILLYTVKDASISISHKYFYLLLTSCFHMFKWFQVLLCINNN